jgi:hypothetical protein
MDLIYVFFYLLVKENTFPIRPAYPALHFSLHLCSTILVMGKVMFRFVHNFIERAVDVAIKGDSCD